MEILHENSNFPKKVSLILGFFDGIHAGHQEVIQNTSNSKKVLITFSSSPAEFFGKDFSYIYTREKNYKLIEKLGVDYIYERDFKNIAQLSNQEYLSDILKKFEPLSISTGFNHTFGANKQGNSEYLHQNQTPKGYKYFCIPPTKKNNEIVSSSKIKEFLSKGEIEKANLFLTRKFSIESTVIEGNKLGRTLGFPTANMKYPEKIIKIPYGVYKIRVFEKPAIMNWGVKPTIGSDEVLEVYIPNFERSLYGEKLQVELISKIRDEKKFNNLEELKRQIKKDVEECLK